MTVTMATATRGKQRKVAGAVQGSVLLLFRGPQRHFKLNGTKLRITQGVSRGLSDV